MRTLSPEATRAGHDQQTDTVWIVLLEITAAGLATPIRVASDNQDVIHQGWTFIGYLFEVELPPESPDRPMSCPNCGLGTLEPIATILAPDAIARILDANGRRSRAPPG